MIEEQQRSIVVVGGASGIGRECVDIARRIYEDVTVFDRDAPDDHVRSDLAVHVVQGDVTEEGAITAALEDVVARVGQLDAVVDMVGGASPRPFLDLSPEQWDDEVDFNLRSAYLVCAAAAGHMVARGAGSIVLASSGYASRPGPGRVAYAAAKAGVQGLSRSLAAELGPAGVRVNVLAPGPTDTARFRDLLSEDEVAAVRSLAALGRLSTARDGAEAAMFLASPGARQITGQILHVNGGTYMPSG